MMTGHKPNLKNMHIFGTVCYAYVQNNVMAKIAAKLDYHVIIWDS